MGLIFLSGVMLIGSFLAGAIPIVMHMSEVSISLHDGWKELIVFNVLIRNCER